MPRLPLAGDARHLHGTARDLPRTLAEIRARRVLSSHAPPAAPVVWVYVVLLTGQACAACPSVAAPLSDSLGTHGTGPQVGPRFNTKYQTAAESALNHCYRSCLEVGLRCAAGPQPLAWLGAVLRCTARKARPSLMWTLHCSCRTATGWQSPCDGRAMREALVQALTESQLGTIAVPCIYTAKKGFPRDLAAHIALRTVTPAHCTALSHHCTALHCHTTPAAGTRRLNPPARNVRR